MATKCRKGGKLSLHPSDKPTGFRVYPKKPAWCLNYMFSQCHKKGAFYLIENALVIITTFSRLGTLKGGGEGEEDWGWIPGFQSLSHDMSSPVHRLSDPQIPIYCWILDYSNTPQTLTCICVDISPRRICKEKRIIIPVAEFRSVKKAGIDNPNSWICKCFMLVQTCVWRRRSGFVLYQGARFESVIWPCNFVGRHPPSIWPRDWQE